MIFFPSSFLKGRGQWKHLKHFGQSEAFSVSEMLGKEELLASRAMKHPAALPTQGSSGWRWRRGAVPRARLCGCFQLQHAPGGLRRGVPSSPSPTPPRPGQPEGVGKLPRVPCEQGT